MADFPSESARRLAAHVEQSSLRAAARRIGRCSHVTVKAAIDGTSTPSEQLRRRIKKAYPDVAPSGWEEAPYTSTAHPADADAEVSDDALPSDSSAESQLRDELRSVDAQLQSPRLTPRARIDLTKLKVALLSALVKIEGPPDGNEVVQTILTALRPFPCAIAAVAAALGEGSDPAELPALKLPKELMWVAEWAGVAAMFPAEFAGVIAAEKRLLDARWRHRHEVDETLAADQLLPAHAAERGSREIPAMTMIVRVLCTCGVDEREREVGNELRAALGAEGISL